MPRFRLKREHYVAVAHLILGGRHAMYADIDVNVDGQFRVT